MHSFPAPRKALSRSQLHALGVADLVDDFIGTLISDTSDASEKEEPGPSAPLSRYLKKRKRRSSQKLRSASLAASDEESDSDEKVPRRKRAKVVLGRCFIIALASTCANSIVFFKIHSQLRARRARMHLATMGVFGCPPPNSPL